MNILNFKNNTAGSSANKQALLFGFIAVFLVGMGFSIATPVIPFVVNSYISQPGMQAIVVTLLISVYALGLFFSAPVLGWLSDRYGRKPILIISLLGTSLGYLIFGIGGTVGVLFLGRIIEGVTSGSISALFAYFADSTPSESRTKYFGWVSAFAGLGSIMGPTIGGLLAAKFGVAAPFYFGALLSLFNAVYGFIVMQESLPKAMREKRVDSKKLNPFNPLRFLFKQKKISELLVSVLFLWLAGGSLQAILSQYTLDTFQWKVTLIGLVFSIIGIQDILSQAFIMPKFIQWFSDRQMIKIGLFAEIFGYLFMALSSLQPNGYVFIVGMFCFGFGDAIVGPAYNGYLSKAVSEKEQGRIQGSSQSLQALARSIGPLLGGAIYTTIGAAAPMYLGVCFLSFSFLLLSKRKRKKYKVATQESNKENLP